MDHGQFRSAFAACESLAYFNHAAVSPLPRQAVEAETAFLQDRARFGPRHYGDWIALAERARTLAAGLIGADPDEIAIVGNTSTALSLVAAGLDFRLGDRVAVTSPDFPSVLHPWQHLQNRGVVVDLIEREVSGRVGLGRIKAALTCRPKLLCVSSVDFATGAALDLNAVGALCRMAGTLFCVDAIQSLGLTPTDVRAAGIDFLACGTHKWLCGPLGLGLFFVARDRTNLLDPALVGWRSVTDEEIFRPGFELKSSALKFEPGTLNFASLAALEQSLLLLDAAGPARMFTHVLELLDALRNGLAERGLTPLSPWGNGERSGILSFPVPDPERLFQRLNDRGVCVSLRAGRIRLSPHYSTSEADVERFFAELDAALTSV